MPLALTVEAVLPADIIDELYGMYAAAFEPLKVAAAARHMLTADEFREEMLDERIEKYLVRDGDSGGVPVGIGTLATDVEVVTWISTLFYRHRYPEHAARGALFYLRYTLVDPAQEHRGIRAMIMDAIVQRVTDAQGVCGVDMSRLSQERQVGAGLAAWGEVEVAGPRPPLGG